MIKTKAFVFRSIKTKDNTYIVKCYTETLGLISFIIIVSQNKGKIKSSYLLPLTMLEISFEHHQNKELQKVSDIAIYSQFVNISTSIIKQSVIYFINEVLAKSIKEEEQNPRLFSFIYNTLEKLDSLDTFYFFTIQFLLDLSVHLGIYPEDNLDNNHFLFSLDEGRFIDTPTAGSKCINEDESRILSSFLKNDFNIEMNKATRNRMVQILVEYFDEHIPDFGLIKSTHVLAEVFD
jgi:DNA repair protein RecO (recombination protein O)